MKQPQAQTINLQTAFAIAFAAHVVLIAALAFTAPTPEPHKTLDVTFSINTSNKNTPKNAKHIASENQEASGTVTSDSTPTTTERNQQVGEVVQETQHQKLKQVKQSTAQQIVTTKAIKEQKAINEDELDEQEQADDGQSDIERQIAEMRALEARLAREQQAYAQRPKVHRFTSVAALASKDAAYLKQWQERVETIGNANYPASAVAQGLFGDVTLKVTQSISGALKEIEIIKSSGHRLLDEAARKSVELAAPFSPYPDNLGKEQDIVEIFRTWQFRNNSLATIDG